MPSGGRSLAKDVLLRVIGLGLITLALAAVRHLYAMVHVPPMHEGSPAEMAMGAVAFLSASAGATLAALGIHIFDEVEISPRWAPRVGNVHLPFDQ
jgi:hypothetical protein